MPRKAKKTVAKRKPAAKRKRQAGGRRQMLQGQGFFGDIGNWFKKAGRTVYDKAIRPVYDKAVRPAYDFARDNKLVSKGLGVVGAFAPDPIGTAAKAGSVAAGLAGLGRGKNIQW
jgi:hypothetical protein